MEQNGKLEYYAAAILENMDNFRRELTKAYHALNNTGEEKVSIKGFANSCKF